MLRKCFASFPYPNPIQELWHPQPPPHSIPNRPWWSIFLPGLMLTTAVPMTSWLRPQWASLWLNRKLQADSLSISEDIGALALLVFAFRKDRASRSPSWITQQKNIDVLMEWMTHLAPPKWFGYRMSWHSAHYRRYCMRVSQLTGLNTMKNEKNTKQKWLHGWQDPPPDPLSLRLQSCGSAPHQKWCQWSKRNQRGPQAWKTCDGV